MHREIFRGLSSIREQCLVSAPTQGRAVGVYRGSLVPVVPREHPAQKTPLSLRVWFADWRFPFGAGDCLQNMALVKGEKSGLETGVCVWWAMLWFCCRMKFLILSESFPQPNSLP